jgi:hypothetical protein
MRCRFAAGLTAAASLVAVAACSGTPPQQQPPRQAQPSLVRTSSASAIDCSRQPPVSPLPVWARSGFNPPDTAMPHVMGAAGNIVAILWATRDALHAPPLPNPHNKILWVSRFFSPGPMTIRATLAGSTRTATVHLPNGPGPSYVNMPAPGCWTLHLTWSGHTDQLSLRYVR